MATIPTKEYNRRVKLLRSWPISQADGSVKNMNLIDGFKAADGFDLRKQTDFSPSQKAKVTRAYNEIDQLLARQVHPYRPRKKKHLEQAQRYAQHEVKIKGLKYALIPTYGETKPEIRFDSKDRIHVKYNGADRVLVDMDPTDLIYDPQETIKTAIQEQAPHAHTFLVRAGKYEIPQLRDEPSITQDIVYLMNRYDLEGDNHHWENWLHGVVAFSSDYVHDTEDMIMKKIISGREYRKKRRSEKRKVKNEYREDKILNMAAAIERKRGKRK